MNEPFVAHVLHSSARDWTVEITVEHEARQLRSAFRDHIVRYATGDSDFAAAELIFAELLANVLRHAPGPAQANLTWGDIQPTLVFLDEGGGFRQPPRLTFEDLAAESGRGLAIINALAAGMVFGNRPNRGAFVRVILPIVRCAEQAS